jgi:hypothetical protein
MSSWHGGSFPWGPLSQAFRCPPNRGNFRYSSGDLGGYGTLYWGWGSPIGVDAYVGGQYTSNDYLDQQAGWGYQEGGCGFIALGGCGYYTSGDSYSGWGGDIGLGGDVPFPYAYQTYTWTSTWYNPCWYGPPYC